jgi:hypothetical protein
MRTLRIALWILLPLVASGCRTDPNQVLLERESRLLEDKIYHLESLLDDCHAAREATIRENEALKKELASGDRGAGPAAREPRQDYQAPSIELPSANGEPPRRSRRKEAPKLEPPTIELPEPSDTPPVEMTPGDASAAVVEGPATQLVINKRLTGGLDRDGRNGDEGILVMVEPRDAQGRLVKTSGAVSVVVMDPALEGDATRVARWDFEPQEVSSHFHNTVFGRGLQFELPWPNEPPQNRKLRLFVRFISANGRKITSDVPIEVRAPSDPPREDRQTKSRPATESAGRAPRGRVPSSRLKRPPAGSQATSELAPSESDQEDDSPGRSDPDKDEAVQQATRPDRPVWKPYR